MKKIFSILFLLMIIQMATYGQKVKSLPKKSQEEKKLGSTKNFTFYKKLKKNIISPELDRKMKSLKSSSGLSYVNFDNLEPGSTQPAPIDQAIQWIKNYQNPLIANNDVTSTRYVDIYFENLDNLLLQKIYQEQKNDPANKMGIRLYLMKKDGKLGVLMSPIKTVDGKMDKINVLWRTDPSRYSAVDYGSTCPENCSLVEGKKDLLGY